MSDIEREGLLMMGMAVAYLKHAGWEIEQISDFVLQGYDHIENMKKKREQTQ